MAPLSLSAMLAAHHRSAVPTLLACVVILGASGCSQPTVALPEPPVAPAHSAASAPSASQGAMAYGVRGPVDNPDPHPARREALGVAGVDETALIPIRESELAQDVPAVRMAGAAPTGRLPPETIQAVVKDHMGPVRTCYEKGLHMNPDPSARVSVSFTIERDGSVQHARSKGDRVAGEVATCIANAFKSLSFPRPQNGTVHVTYPILLGPG